MEFKQDAAADLKLFRRAMFSEQVALARFGDGEEKMYLGAVYHCSDGWVSKPNKNSLYRKKLGEAIHYSHPNYYIGIRYPRNLRMFAWAVRNIATPPERMCDPCLFVNSRWAGARKWFNAVRKKCVVVGSGKGVNFKIPHNCIKPEYKYGALLKKLLKVKKPILLAAGPLANILVMEYLKAGGKQSIVDIGTVLDVEMFGHATRRYQRLALRKKPKPLAKKKAKRKPKKKVKRKTRKAIKRRPRRPPTRKSRRRVRKPPRFSQLRTRNTRRLKAKRRHK